MDDDLYTRYVQSAVDAAARLAFQKGLEIGVEQGREQGREQGFMEGMAAGQVIGFAAGVEFCTPAVSDGLRSGSSECGRTLQAFQNMGLGEQK